MILYYILISLTIFYSECHEIGDFEGKEHWVVALETCKTTRNGPIKNNLRCYWINDKMHIFKLEVLSESPLLLRYHQLIHRRHCKRIINDVKEMRLEKAGVASSDPQNPVLQKKNRMANSTWVGHRNVFTFNAMFNKLQRTLLSMDLSKAESFQVLSYDKFGHYAPHFDYLESDIISTVKEQGNRIATVLTILQTAKLGGTTTFPQLQVNVRPAVGDVLVWHNMNSELKRDSRSLHAACPILEGTKIGATLWVRSKGQEFRLKCDRDKKLSMDRYINPDCRIEDNDLFTKPSEPSK